eukprot:TRINITY_DN11802_c0_g3_i4.p5 TRINITY_DN11802_c0_g3~~TRINITY_DN11802_c0_g3_i4.p5  ORF type:complete len:111 (+),score=33.17 TRINITY_DN11802_c0_g3_i4:885-1217(+)
MQGGAQQWRQYIKFKVTPLLEEVMDRLLIFNPADRFQDAYEVMKFIQKTAPQVWITHDTTTWKSPSQNGIAPLRMRSPQQQQATMVTTYQPVQQQIPTTVAIQSGPLAPL